MVTTTAPSDVKLITGEELQDMGDIGPCELIDGRIMPMSLTGGEHGILAACRRETSEVSRTGFTGKVTLIIRLICR